MTLWHWRILGVALAALYFLRCLITPAEYHFIDSANLIFHEAGHAIFFFLGDWAQALMGSGFQVLLPALIALYFFATDQRLSAGFCLMWMGQNFANVSVYAGDAIQMQLPLLGGDSSMHDWNYLLRTAGLLQWTPQVAGVFYTLGITGVVVGLMLSLAALTKEKATTK